LKTITRRSKIGTSTPVFGLRPMRWPFERTTKAPEGRQLDRFAARCGVTNFVEDGLDKCGRFRARKTDPAISDLGEVGARHGPTIGSVGLGSGHGSPNTFSRRQRIRRPTHGRRAAPRRRQTP
jgi:hypothetical protein